MTDHKFTDREIMDALRCHADESYRCESCPYRERGGCSLGMSRDAFDLISRQKAEIEILKKIGDSKTSELLRHDASIRELHKQLETARSEAIKEFAERLIKKCDAPHWCVWMSEIEDLLEEMTEEKKL